MKPKAKGVYLKTRDGKVIKSQEGIKKYIADFVPRLIALQPPPAPRRPPVEELDEEEFMYDFSDPASAISDDAEDEGSEEVKRRQKEFEQRTSRAGAPAKSPAPPPAKNAPPADEEAQDEDFGSDELYDYWSETLGNGDKGE